MSYVDWQISCRRIATCSCDDGCPCEFNAPPTRVPCEGVEALDIVDGNFGETRLDGLSSAGVYSWPGPVHEGGGRTQVVIDDRVTDAQRDALFSILSGEEQEPHTGFNIYGSTIDEEFDPIIAPVNFEFDLKERTATLSVESVLNCTLEPIRNPVTGASHRALIKLPDGFEFREAEMASATFTSEGHINQSHSDRYGFLTFVTYGPYGMVKESSYPQMNS
ncbi:MAG: DUF1326 domain-containing protein [Bacteroidetes bacterium]|nr:DUF1326 domain-containing protein [Bacteroidota bacterium]